MPRPLQMLKNQILLGSSCARSSQTRTFICIKVKDRCVPCKKYLTPTQKSSATIRVHVMCYVDESQAKEVRFSALSPDFVEVLRTAPNPKHWRIVTCSAVPNGVRVLCSCGYGMRNMTCCLHAFLLLQKSSGYRSFGCEEESLHIHTNLFATLQNASNLQRYHDDWAGILNSTITIHDVTKTFREDAMDDAECESELAAQELQHKLLKHGTRHQGDLKRQLDEDRASKAHIMSSVRSHFQDVVNIIESLSLDDVRSTAKIFEDVIYDFAAGSATASQNLSCKTACCASRNETQRQATEKKGFTGGCSASENEKTRCISPGRVSCRANFIAFNKL
jgi:hypothetical protein